MPPLWHSHVPPFCKPPCWTLCLSRAQTRPSTAYQQEGFVPASCLPERGVGGNEMRSHPVNDQEGMGTRVRQGQVRWGVISSSGQERGMGYTAPTQIRDVTPALNRNPAWGPPRASAMPSGGWGWGQTGLHANEKAGAGDPSSKRVPVGGAVFARRQTYRGAGWQFDYMTGQLVPGSVPWAGISHIFDLTHWPALDPDRVSGMTMITVPGEVCQAIPNPPSETVS